MKGELEYLRNGPRKAVQVKATRPYCLLAQFDDGISKEYDMKDDLTGVLAPLKDYTEFKKVYIDDLGAIAWDVDGKHLDTSRDTIYIYGREVLK